MTVEERVSRLEEAMERLTVETNSFVRSAAEFNNTVTAAISTLSKRAERQDEIINMLSRKAQDHDEIIDLLSHKAYDHDAMIERLDRMIARFDEWLRGQGPPDGHEKRNPNT